MNITNYAVTEELRFIQSRIEELTKKECDIDDVIALLVINAHKIDGYLQKIIDECMESQNVIESIAYWHQMAISDNVLCKSRT